MYNVLWISQTGLTRDMLHRFSITLALLLFCLGNGVMSQGSPQVVTVTCPSQTATSTPSCTQNNGSPVVWIKGTQAGGGVQIRSLTFNITALIVNSFEIDLAASDDLEMTVQLQGSAGVWIVSFSTDCADSYVRRRSEREVYSCRNVYTDTNCTNCSSTGPISIPAPSGVFAVSTGSSGKFHWWQSFTQVQVNVTSFNSSVNGLRIYGANEPAQPCNCHPVGVANISDPCNATSTTSGICKCRANFTNSNQCIPQLGGAVPYGPQSGGYLLALGTSGGGSIGDRPQISIGASYNCSTPTPNISIRLPANELVCNVTRASSTDLNRPLPITVCWSLENNQTTACIILVDSFTYKPDPSITSVTPLKGFSAGGTKQTFTGTNLDSIYKVQSFVVLNVTYISASGPSSLCFYDTPDHTLKYCPPKFTDQTICEMHSNMSTIVCASPPFLETTFLDYSEQSILWLNLYNQYGSIFTLKFKFQQAPIESEFIDLSPETQEYRIYEEEKTTFKIYWDTSKNSGRYVPPGLTLSGAQTSDYSVTIGGVPASLSWGSANNLVVFTPPLPEPADSLLDLYGAKQIVISVGYYQQSVGYLDYQQNWIDTPAHRNALIGGLVGGVGGAIVIIVLIILICKCRRKEKPPNPSQAGDSLYNPRYTRPNTIVPPGGFLDQLNPPRLRDQVNTCLVKFNRLHIEKEIGKGYFGKVLCGTLSNETGETKENVAIKVLHGSTSIDDIEDFLEEAVIMMDFSHDNVLGLRAIAIHRNIPYVILPFMEHGDLKSFITNKDNQVLHVLDLIDFGLQIAEGMEYLSVRKFVHRDIAARNCMINSEMVCKVADFGLARDVYQKDYYRPSKRPRPLPIKWMSVEAMDGFFTTKSDVWSYGVLLWELLTRGRKPYADVDIEYMPRHLRNPNHRLEKPAEAPEFMYALMTSCWLPDPDARPSFTDIKCELKNRLAVYQARRHGEDEYTQSPRSPNKPVSYITLVEMVPAADYLTNSDK